MTLNGHLTGLGWSAELGMYCFHSIAEFLVLYSKHWRQIISRAYTLCVEDLLVFVLVDLSDHWSALFCIKRCNQSLQSQRRSKSSAKILWWLTHWWEILLWICIQYCINRMSGQALSACVHCVCCCVHVQLSSVYWICVNCTQQCLLTDP